MAHSTAEIVQSRLDLEASIEREIAIHEGYIGALRNALRGMRMVTASATSNGKGHVPSDELPSDELPIELM